MSLYYFQRQNIKQNSRSRPVSQRIEAPAATLEAAPQQEAEEAQPTAPVGDLQSASRFCNPGQLPSCA